MWQVEKLEKMVRQWTEPQGGSRSEIATSSFSIRLSYMKVFLEGSGLYHVEKPERWLFSSMG